MAQISVNSTAPAVSGDEPCKVLHFNPGAQSDSEFADASESTATTSGGASPMQEMISGGGQAGHAQLAATPPKTDLKADLLGGAAFGPIADAAAPTLDEKAAALLENLRPIREKGAGLVADIDRSRKVLYSLFTEAAKLLRSTPKSVVAKAVEQVLGQKYDPAYEYSYWARLCFGICNEPVTDDESRRRNQAKNSIVYKLAQGLKRIDRAIERLEVGGETVESEFVVQILLDPGSGGLRGAADLLDSSAFYAGVADTEAGTGSESGNGSPNDDSDGDESEEESGDDDETDDDETVSGSDQSATGTAAGATTKGADTKGTDKTDKKAKDKSVSKVDREKLLGLPDLSLDDITAKYPQANEIFAVIFKKSASGMAVPVASAPVTAAIIKPFLPTVSGSSVDPASMFMAEALVLAHSVTFKPKSGGSKVWMSRSRLI